MHNVNFEQTSSGSRMISPQKQSLVVKTRQKETRKKHHHEVSSSKMLMVQIVIIRPLTKALGLILIIDVCSHLHQNIEMMIK